MQNSVMRVRGSLGLKFPSEFSEKGSARIETDSSTIARVEVAETLNNSGLLWVAPDVLEAPHMNAVRPAHTVARKRLREVKARILIRVFSLSQTIPTIDNEADQIFGGGATGRLHPGSTEYNITNRRSVNIFRRSVD